MDSSENKKVVDGVILLSEFDETIFGNPPSNQIYLFAEDDGTGTTVVKTKDSAGAEVVLGVNNESFLPTDIPNCQLWLRASDVASLADGASVTLGALLDRSGNGNNPTAISGVTKTTGYDGRACLSFSAGAITLPSIPVNKIDSSVYIVVRPKLTHQDTLGKFIIDLGTGLQFGLWQNPGPQLWNGGGSPAPTIKTQTPSSAFSVFGFRASSTKVSFRLNDWIQSASASSSGTVTGGKIGGAANSSSYDFKGQISEVIIFSRALTDAEELTLLAYFNHPPYTHNIWWDGDSLSYGYNSSLATNSLMHDAPSWMMNRIMGDSARISNVSVAGQTLVSMESDASTTIDVFYDAQGFPQKNILIVWGGTNDINGGSTGAAAYTNLTTYCNSRRAAGWKVYTATMISRTGFDATKETHRQTFNTSLRSGWPAICDGLVDLDANTPIGGVGTYSNTTYYDSDATHLTRKGYEIVARSFYNAITTPTLPNLKPYTVSTLPSGAYATIGMTAYVTDATSPTYLGALTGGGSGKCPVFYNGSSWVSN